MSLLNSLSAVKDRIRYDHEAKHVLANKQILSRILRECVDEFKDKSLPEIINAIDNDMKIGTISVEPGLTNQAESLSQENNEPGEGTVYFDLLFSAVATGTKPIRVRINLEAQNDYHPGYDSITRGVFYCARLISSQAETVFSLAKQEYDKIEKVYSIWIFMNATIQDSDTITSYRIKPERIYGNFHGKARYDLMEVIAICLNPEPDKSRNRLVNILSTLFTDRFNTNQKVRKLKDYGVPVNNEFRKEINKVSNLGDGIERKGYDRGYEQRKSEERHMVIHAARNLLNKMNDEEISDTLSNNITPEEVGRLRKGEKFD